MCQFIPADAVEGKIVETFFQALLPIELDAYTEAVGKQEEANQELVKAYTQLLQRLKYQAKLAECQFNQVDPNNRLVAAQLETRWETALYELKKAEESFEKKQCTLNNNSFSIPDELKSVFMDVGKRLPYIWESEVLSLQQKKAFLRCLIEKIIIHREKRDCLLIRIVWKGGETTTLEQPILVGSFSDLTVASELEQLVLQLVKDGLNDEEIANHLTRLGYRSPMKQHFLPSTVATIRWKKRVFRERKKPQPLQVNGCLTVLQISKIIDVSKRWTYDRIRYGNIKVKKDNEIGAFLFPDTPKTIKMFKQLKNGSRNSINFSKEHQDE